MASVVPCDSRLPRRLPRFPSGTVCDFPFLKRIVYDLLRNRSGFSIRKPVALLRFLGQEFEE